MDKDNLEKAKEYSQLKDFNIGAYSESRGVLKVRETIADHLKQRDNLKDFNVNDIYLTNGGINAYDLVLTLIFNKGEKVT